MFFGYTGKFLFVTLLFGAVSPALCSLKNNDFTKANTSFSRKYETLSNPFNGLRARGADKKFPTNPYSYEDKTRGLRDKEAPMTKTDKLGNMDQRRDRRSGKPYDSIPDYSRRDERWRNDGLKMRDDNLSRNMNKEYRGRFADKTLKPRFSTEEIRNNYEEMLERSIGDINKYQYGASRQSSPEAQGPLPVVRAGGEHDAEDTGIFDFLKSHTHIDRPTVGFKGALKPSKTPLPERENTPEVEPIRGREPAPDTAPGAVLPPIPVSQPNGNISASVSTTVGGRANRPLKNVMVDKKTGERRVLKSITEVDSDLDILNNVPKDWRAGKPQIKIEVNE